MMRAQDPGLATRVTVARSDIIGLAALLQKFLYHPERNAVTVGDFISGSLLVVV
jgi:hypothetical protein